MTSVLNTWLLPHFPNLVTFTIYLDLKPSATARKWCLLLHDIVPPLWLSGYFMLLEYHLLNHQRPCARTECKSDRLSSLVDLGTCPSLSRLGQAVGFLTPVISPSSDQAELVQLLGCLGGAK